MSNLDSYTSVGRRDAVADAVRTMQAGRPVLVYGGAGVGKTYVGALIVHRLLVMGGRVLRLRPATLGVRVSGGLAQLGAAEDYRFQPMASYSIAELDQLLGRPDRPDFIHVDDAHMFDDEHNQWLVSVANRREVTLLIAFSTEVGPDMPANTAMSALWLDGDATRVDLGAFSAEETMQMVTSIVGEVPVDTASRVAVYRGSGGLPLLIQELVQELLKTGLADGGTTAFVYPMPHLPSKRVIDVVWHRLRFLTDDERNTLVMLTRLGPTPHERAERYFGERTVRRLVAAGFADLDQADGWVSCARLIESDVVLAVSGTAQLARMSLSIAKIMRKDLRLGVPLRPSEYVLMAETMLGDDNTPGFDLIDGDLDQVAEIFVIAAATCFLSGTVYTGLSFAHASWNARPSASALVEQSRCLSAMGNKGAAHDILDSVAECEMDEFDRGVLERWRTRLASWTAAAEPVAARASGWSMARAMEGAMTFDWAVALRHAQHIASSETIDPLTRLQALGIVVICHAQAADGAALIEATTLGDQLVSGLHPQDAYAQIVTDDDVNAYQSLRAAALLISGIQVETVRTELEGWTEQALVTQNHTRLPVLGALIGFVHLCHGAYDAAETELRLATDRMIVLPDARWEVWIPGLRSHSLIARGRSDEAQQVLRHLAEQYPEDSRLRRYATQWINAELSGERQGRKVLHNALFTQSGPPAPKSVNGQLAAMMSATAQGADPGTMVERARELRDATDLPMLHGRADFIIGMADNDADLLQAAARNLGQTGYLAAAKDAAEASARAFTRSGRPSAAIVSSSLARLYSIRHNPTNATEENLNFDLDSLTTREREIVLLISRGYSNRQIADTLFLSIRTVESHFYQARRKLGNITRKELSILSGPTPTR